MSTISVKFGLNLRKQRKAIGLSQDNLALTAEVDRSYIGRIERGEANVTLEMLYKLASVLNCHPRDLLPE
ncbi:MAG TPA: helix-turn-helix transcriptional regulator [Rheinheimera sp.]|jgi:transcriptional regulator with XRE-family HTH domain|uniref:Helix-turn-helix transcriptional regulator n=2 Tax=Chromatiaceae TaxID=1046 RepID=A0ABS6MJC4_9GAMM|nr:MULTISPECIES: helix-turn-helix transcriptional regulator [Chromatiaceae]MBJ92766.1 transcriptional regulator [Alteromonadaceae bacterium]MBV2128916.1 helix-turn-helix transcriptional regulator [Arsukibacterium indicum]MCB5214323.1 helix-turn-helix transcriptional regulator [Rheinheimera aquimaris]MCD1600216.1 helix-turn-helix transcriptional regulator [Rheinheimera aquimaris]|tara:strand:- start:437 stop:646 length:210 start_codon:yes stop_codon:yes gene_type:complete